MSERFYFSHDYGARNDPKLQRLQMEMGHEGKGIYWDLVEMLYENGGRLKMSDIKSIAFGIRVEYKKVEKLIKSEEFDLFKIKDGYFYSSSAIERLEKRYQKSKQAKKAAEKRWSKNESSSADELYDEHFKEETPETKAEEPLPIKETPKEEKENASAMRQHTKNDADAMHPHTKTDADAYENTCGRNAIKERKGKESKEKDNKGKKEEENKVNKLGRASPAGYFTLLKTEFLEAFKQKKGLDYYFTAKDAGALKQLEKKIEYSFRAAHMEVSEEGMRSTIRIMVTQHGQKWIDDNLSIPILNSKYNEIVAGIKQKKGRGSTEGLKREIYSRIFSNAGPTDT